MNRRFLLLCSAILCTCMIAFGQREDVLAKPHGTCVLQCYDEVEAVNWYGPNENKITDDKKYTIDGANDSLTVSNIGEADLGVYRCEILPLKYNKTFQIFTPPYIDKKMLEKSVNLVQGDKLELTCSAWGNPSPKIIWIKNWEGENMELTASNHVLLSSNGKLNDSQLNIREVTYNDYGFYTCNATNEYGTVQSTIKVRVKDKLAPLWPFIGICAEVLVLALIIIIYEKRKSKQHYDEDAKEEGNNQTNSNDHQDKEKARLRK